ncbi:MAG TPA: hypothetical protein VG318_13865 [Actinomycetota bacterium]|nr:hypothetical protein [Actinomycetota bacterium]
MKIVLEGAIAGLAFASGDNFVVGLWDSGPLGPMTDVMWARPDGSRVLLAPDEDVAAFVAGTYSFDETRVVPIRAARSREGFSVTAGDVHLDADAGRAHPLFAARPRPLRRWLPWVRFEDAVLRRLVGRFVVGGAEGVRMHGTTPSGAREWYRIDGYRTIVAARGEVAGADLGALTELRPDPGFGFSGFPSRPALVSCSPVIDRPPG